MPGGYYNIDIAWEGKNGPTSIQRSLATFGQSVAHMQPAWERVGAELLLDFQKNFETEGGQFGVWSKWAPLAPATVAERRRLGYGAAHPILQRSGALYQSVVVRGAPDNVFEATDTGLTIGTTNRYAGYHNSGAPRTRLPRRPIIALSSARQGFGSPAKSIVGILNAYLAEQLAAANLTARGFEYLG